MGTQAYYDTHATRLLQEYQQADMTVLHQLLNKYIHPHSKVCDIGFGSMRELEHLHSHGNDIWGVDATEAFVSNAQKHFPEIKEHFIQATLPFQRPLPFSRDFDAVISIALWMHLKKEQYTDAVKDITALFGTKKGVVVLSFSKGSRNDTDERYFEEVDIEYLNKIFSRYDFYLTEQITTADSLQRGNLSWITLVYKND